LVFGFFFELFLERKRQIFHAHFNLIGISEQRIVVGQPQLQRVRSKTQVPRRQCSPAAIARCDGPRTMQNLQNMFGIPNVQQHFNQQQAQMAQQQQRQAAAPSAKCLADAPICNPNATSKELYAVENALKKDYDPIKREWVEENIKIQIERKPFAEGAMRAAYRMKIIEGMDVHGADRYYVLKLSKDPHEPTRQYYKDVETQMESRKWATEYNKRGVPKQVLAPAHLPHGLGPCFLHTPVLPRLPS
jgi:hypothetical protein